MIHCNLRLFPTATHKINNHYMWTDTNPIKIFEYARTCAAHDAYSPTPTPNKSHKCIQSIYDIVCVCFESLMFTISEYTYTYALPKSLMACFYYNKTHEEVNNLNNTQCYSSFSLSWIILVINLNSAEKKLTLYTTTVRYL